MKNEPQSLTLNKLVGKWNTTGKVFANQGQPEHSIGGTDCYEWLLDNKFLLHQVDVIMGDQNHCSLEVICPNLESDTSSVVAIEADARCENSSITIIDNQINIWNDKLKFEGTFDKDFNQIKGMWQKAIGNDWIDFMEIQLDKDLEEHPSAIK